MTAWAVTLALSTLLLASILAQAADYSVSVLPGFVLVGGNYTGVEAPDRCWVSGYAAIGSSNCQLRLRLQQRKLHLPGRGWQRLHVAA